VTEDSVFDPEAIRGEFPALALEAIAAYIRLARSLPNSTIESSGPL
jgi:hypothetical protein